tara:strand:+ start:783 stop:1259 length:477 start_codon:yes stop_codon:yes gene_type:complete
MVAFYFFSLIPIVLTMAHGIYVNGWDTPINQSRDLGLFLSSLFFAPWFETLLLNVMLTKLFSKMKCRPTTIIIAVSLIFAAAHTANGWFSPFLVFIPALMFQWNYYLYYDKEEAGWGFLSTTVLHFLYNFTIFVVIPLIYIVLDIYYDVGRLQNLNIK